MSAGELDHERDPVGPCGWCHGTGHVLRKRAADSSEVGKRCEPCEGTGRSVMTGCNRQRLWGPWSDVEDRARKIIGLEPSEPLPDLLSLQLRFAITRMARADNRWAWEVSQQLTDTIVLRYLLDHAGLTISTDEQGRDWATWRAVAAQQGSDGEPQRPG